MSTSHSSFRLSSPRRQSGLGCLVVLIAGTVLGLFVFRDDIFDSRNRPSTPTPPTAQRPPAPSRSTAHAPSGDQAYPFKLVTILSEPAEFGGARCSLTVDGEGWHKSRTDGVWNAVLRRRFGDNEVSCLLESDDISTVQRVELEAEFYQPGLHEAAMLLQFSQSAQILMHPTQPPTEFAEAVARKGDWSNEQWELKRELYTNGGFGLMLRRKSP